MNLILKYELREREKYFHWLDNFGHFQMITNKLSFIVKWFKLILWLCCFYLIINHITNLELKSNMNNYSSPDFEVYRDDLAYMEDTSQKGLFSTITFFCKFVL